MVTIPDTTPATTSRFTAVMSPSAKEIAEGIWDASNAVTPTDTREYTSKSPPVDTGSWPSADAETTLLGALAGRSRGVRFRSSAGPREQCDRGRAPSARMPKAPSKLHQTPWIIFQKLCQRLMI